ncbi:hypothetical protein MASR2M78_10520 [Treponema sp.]
MATARSTLAPTTAKIAQEAADAGFQIELRTILLEEALSALKAGEGDRHDRILEDAAREIGDLDVVVLAQASMARAERRVAEACGVPVLSSPGLCVAEVKQFLEG